MCVRFVRSAARARACACVPVCACVRVRADVCLGLSITSVDDLEGVQVGQCAQDLCVCGGGGWREGRGGECVQARTGLPLNR